MNFGAATPASPSPFGSPLPAFGAQQQPATGGFNFAGRAASTPLFGAAPTPGPFGAANTGGGLFGAASTPAFGAASTPAFGAAATPAFGAAPAQPFGAASTPAFGAATQPLFGGAATSTFGATSSPLFGAQQATPGFGAASAPAFGMGTSLFGGASAGAFGTTTTPGFGTNLFKPAGSPQQGVFGSPFGQASTPGLQAGSVFQTTQPGFLTGGFTTQTAPVMYAAGGQQDSMVRELTDIRSAHDPNNPAFRYRALFLNVVDNPGQRMKPPFVDEARWQQALREAGGENNPDRLWPVVASGFRDLVLRLQAQQAALDEHRDRVARLKQIAADLSTKHGGELKERVERVGHRHVQLAHRLLGVYRNIDALESRFANQTSVSVNRDPSQERELASRLKSVAADLSSSTGANLQRRLEAVGAVARLRSETPLAGLMSGQLNEASFKALFDVLKEMQEGIENLRGVLQQDLQDVEVIKRAQQPEGNQLVPMFL